MTSRTNTRYTTRARAAFTLPELLVVVTVTLVLMSILVQASTIITNTVSEAKAQGDFVGQERMAIAVMRRDLQYDHFFDDDSNDGPSKGRKLSDIRTDRATKTGTTIGGTYKPPRSGYFWARAGVADGVSNFDEPSDGVFSSSRSGNHFMQFTVVAPGGAPQNTLTADIPMGKNVITGTCAEIAYYLEPNGTTPNSVPKYKLIRRQRLAARNTDDDPAYASLLDSYLAPASDNMPITDPPEVVACAFNTSRGKFDMFNMNELAGRGNRLFGTLPTGSARTAIATHRIGEDVLHNHVTSFELKFTGSAGAAAGVAWPKPFSQNTDFPYDTLPFDGEYDTGDETLLGSATNLSTGTTNTTGRIKPIRITGVQIRLRCWNPSNKQTRQTTTIVDL